jgi:hypothetical protein
MSMIRKVNAWLVKNHMVEGSTDYIGIVAGNGNIGIREIIEELIAEGMELKRETAQDVLLRFNRKCIDLALSGFSVNTGLVNMHATIRGTFHDKKWNSERNRLRVSISSGVELRHAAAETQVEILGEHGDVMTLFGITDMSTGKTDGTVTRGYNAEISGTYIKVGGESPTAGVYLHDAESGSDIKLPAVNIVINEPSRLLLLIPPSLPAGEYTLSVTTQLSTGGKQLKSPRTAVLPVTVTVE